MTDHPATEADFQDDASGDLRCPSCHELVNPAAVEVVVEVNGDDATELRCPVCGTTARYAGALRAGQLGVPPQ